MHPAPYALCSFFYSKSGQWATFSIPGRYPGKLAGEWQLCIFAPVLALKPVPYYMLLIYGRRVAKIKEFSDNSNCCTSCKAFDLQVRVYREYFHLFYIPFMPVSEKYTDIRCNECTEPIRTELLKKVYEKYTRTPFYLYTILLLLAVMISLFAFAGIQGQRERAAWIAKPRVGDVYLVKDADKATTWYFLRIAEINGSTITVYHNKFMYLNYVTRFNTDDHFVKEEEMHLRIEEIQQMYEKDEIATVERGYGYSTGFDRIQ